MPANTCASGKPTFTPMPGIAVVVDALPWMSLASPPRTSLHVMVPDGVFTRTDAAGSVVFREGPSPTRADIAAVAARVEKRMCRWLRRRGLLDERAAEDRSNEAPELSPLEACMQLSLFGSTYVRLAGDGAAVPLAGEEARFRAAGKGPWVAEASGFNVHAGVTIYRP